MTDPTPRVESEGVPLKDSEWVLEADSLCKPTLLYRGLMPSTTLWTLASPKFASNRAWSAAARRTSCHTKDGPS
jgi:hypothetical protein